jgi:leucine dehydrogenase
MQGLRVAVQGVGAVGHYLCSYLHEAGAKLVVADIDRSKRAEADRLGARWTTPAKAMVAPVDLLAPCALGGVLDHESVPALQAPAIAGAANNQLADESIGPLIRGRGIVWAPDFVVNAGGIINISVELGRNGYDPAVARARTREIGDTLRRVFDAADGNGTTTLEAAMKLARARLRPPGATPARPRRRG